MPQPATPAIDSGNALAASLAFACVLGHTVAANKAVDLVTGTLGTLGVDASWVAGPNGAAVRCAPDSHDGSVNFGVMRPLASGASYSAFVLCQPNSVGTYRAIFTARDAYSGMDWSIGTAPDGAVTLGVAGTASSAAGAVVVNGRWVSVGVTVTPTAARVYLDGVLAATVVADLRPLAPVIANGVRIGGIGPADSPESLGGDVECAYLWAGRELSAGDHASLAASPYVFLSVSPGGGGGSSSSRVAASVAGSGTTIAAVFKDAGGVLTPVTSLALGDVRFLYATAAGGPFTLTLAGQTITVPCGVFPSNIDGTSGAGTLQARLEAFATVGVGGVTVTGYNPYRIVFAATQSVLTVDGTGLSSTRAADPLTAGIGTDQDQAIIRETPTRGVLTGLGGGIHGYSTQMPGVAASEVRFIFTVSSPGNYRVLGGWPGTDYGGRWATDAKYRVYDGTTLIRTVVINQAVPVVQVANYGGNWGAQSIGTFYIASGTLTVVIFDDCNAPICVDSMILQAQSPVSSAASSYAVAASVAAVGVPSYAVNGGAAVPLAKAIWSRTSLDDPTISFQISPFISTGDVVTLTIPANVIGTAAGSVGAITSMAVVNKSGSTIVPKLDLSVPRPMRLGWNVFQFDNTGSIYNDIFKSASEWYGPVGVAYNLDAGGNFISGTAQSIVAYNFTDPLSPKGYRNLPPGVYTAAWTGTGTVTSSEESGNPAVVSGAITTFGNGDQTRTFTYALAGTNNGIIPNIGAVGECRNIRLFRPGTTINAATGQAASVFTPQYIAKVAGASCLRFYQWFNPGFNTYTDYSDYPAETDQYYAAFRRRILTVTSIAAYPNTEHYGASAYMPVLVTCSAPHNLLSGTAVTFNSSTGAVTLTRSDGYTTDLHLVNTSAYYNPATMTTGQFVVMMGLAPPRPADDSYAGRYVQMTGTYTAACTATISTASGGSPTSAVDLCNLTGADIWMSISTLEPGPRPDACITALSTMIAGRLAAGKKFIIELGNEPWNYITFPTFHYYENVGRARGSSGGVAYVQDAIHYRTVARAAFTAAGRDPNDVVLYLNTFIGDPSNAYGLIDYLSVNGLPCDAIGGAPYWGAGPAYQTGNDYDSLTGDQVVDLDEIQTAYRVDPFATNIAAVRAYLNSHGFTSTRLISYEGGPGGAGLGGTNIHQAQHTRYWHRSPRSRHLTHHKCAAFQAAGLELLNFYGVTGPYSSEETSAVNKSYGAYTAWDMVAGTGDGTDGLADNTIDPYGTTGVSVIGGAFKAWNAAPLVFTKEYIRLATNNLFLAFSRLVSNLGGG